MVSSWYQSFGLKDCNGDYGDPTVKGLLRIFKTLEFPFTPHVEMDPQETNSGITRMRSPGLLSSEQASCPQGAEVNFCGDKEDTLGCCLGSSCCCRNHSFHMGHVGFKKLLKDRALVYIKIFLCSSVTLEAEGCRHLPYLHQEMLSEVITSPLAVAGKLVNRINSNSRINNIPVFCNPSTKLSVDAD